MPLGGGGGDSKCPGHLESPPLALALRIPPTGILNTPFKILNNMSCVHNILKC